MITAHVQRWREKRTTYRPAGEPINTAAFDVTELRDDATPKAFVERHHYSGTYPAARWRFGLFRRCELVGVAVFSHPTNDKALTSVFPGIARDSVELGRFVLVDDVPANGETWFLGRAFALLRREGLRGVVSFSDPIPRTSSEGALADLLTWLSACLASVRRVRHPGNHRYAWSFSRRERLIGGPYPKHHQTVAERMADGALVRARETKKLLTELRHAGLTKREIAERLGSKASTPSLQLTRRHVRASSALKVRRLVTEVHGELQLEAEIGCPDCGQSHDPEVREAAIRARPDVSRHELSQRFPCWYGGDSGQRRLTRDLQQVRPLQHSRGAA